MDDLFERIQNARDDANYWAREGETDKAVVTLSLADCDAIGELLTAAFGAVLMGKRDAKIADDLAILGGSFRGDDDE